MTRATAAVDRFAKETGIPVATVGRIGRALREATPSLWIPGGAGPGTGQHANNTHLVNLMLGCCVADPITRAARLVTAYREASFLDPDPFKTTAPMMKGHALGERLDMIVDDLAGAKRQNLLGQLHDGDFSVTFVVGDALVAWVRWYDVTDQYDAKRYGDDLLPTLPAALLRTVRLTTVHFEIMADLWRDTIARSKPVPHSLVDDLSFDSSRDEPAASLPGDTAVVADQPAETELDGHAHSHPMNVRAKAQRLSKSRVGHSPKSPRSDRDVDP